MIQRNSYRVTLVIVAITHQKNIEVSELKNIHGILQFQSSLTKIGIAADTFLHFTNMSSNIDQLKSLRTNT